VRPSDTVFCYFVVSIEDFNDRVGPQEFESSSGP
jgi:hypothetical protein